VCFCAIDDIETSCGFGEAVGKNIEKLFLEWNKKKTTWNMVCLSQKLRGELIRMEKLPFRELYCDVNK
jgi:hypothetical protein